MLAPMTAGPIAYVSDVEGQWERLSGFAARVDGVRLEGDRLELADGWTFVFGGDAIDRGPWSRRIVRTLLDAKRRYGPRVVLLAGNRDLNKLRLVRELRGHPPAKAPEDLRSDRPALLRFILGSTMGAGEAFAHRAGELAHEGLHGDDASVVDSFLADLEPGGELARYLSQTQLSFRAGPTLFVHGAITSQSLGHVPGQPPIEGVERWLEALEAFAREQLGPFLVQRNIGPDVPPPWSGLVAYQAPAPGQPTNPQSVVYGRLADAFNNPYLPTRDVVEALGREGIFRLVVGHTPSGDAPAVVRAGAFELVVADSSRGRVASGAGVAIAGEELRVRSALELDDGERVELDYRTRLGAGGDIGLRLRHTRQLVKGPAADGRITLYLGRPGHELEQLAVAPDDARLGALEEAWPP